MSKQQLPQGVDTDKALTARQTEILDHIMLTGESPYKAAETLGTSPRNIYRVLEYPHVKKELQARALQQVGILSLYAVRKQGELLDAESEHVQAHVAENILDRHLGKPVMRSQVALQGRIDVTIDLT